MIYQKINNLIYYMNSIFFLDDIIIQIYKQYIKYNHFCKKNNSIYLITSISSKFYNIYNSHFIINCNLITYPITLCKYHDNISQKYIDSLLEQIHKYNKLNNTISIHDISFNILNNLNINKFIHLENLKKNQPITDLILEKFNLKIKHYCCDGNGCLLINI